MDKEFAQRPPSGLMPEYIWREQRIAEIEEAINRYGNDYRSSPQEWFNEYHEHLKWLKQHNYKKQASKIPAKDYEVIALRGTGSFNPIYNKVGDNLFQVKNEPHYTITTFPNGKHGCEIYSVKRLSDGEVFTIGDNTDDGIIKNFEVGKNKCYAYCKDNNALNECNITMLSKIKQPEILFTTEDGKDIFEGDEFYMIFTAPNGIGKYSKTKARKELLPFQSYQKLFSSEDAALEWLVNYKPVLNYQDIISCCYDHNPEEETMYISREKLKDIIKSKLNQ